MGLFYFMVRLFIILFIFSISCDDDNGSINFDAIFIFLNTPINLSKFFFDEITIKEKINAAVKNPITYAPNSKSQIPKNDTIIKPIRVYNCSRIIIGAVLLLGIPNFVFNIWDLMSSPTLPGMIDSAIPDKQITKLFFFGM